MRGTVEVDRAIAITVDLEWACDEIFNSLLDLFDEYGVQATIFCTHEAEVRKHEAALHPNFLRNGTHYQDLVAEWGMERVSRSPIDVERAILKKLLALYPGARGIRNHSLVMSNWISLLLADSGLRYDSSYYMPLRNVQPFKWFRGVWEVPIFYMDHLDLLDPFSGFSLKRFPLDSPGLKVFDFHPLLLYINACSEDHYQSIKPIYHEPGKLSRHIHSGHGIKTLLIELLEYVARYDVPVVSIGNYLACLEEEESRGKSRGQG